MKFTEEQLNNLGIHRTEFEKLPEDVQSATFHSIQFKRFPTLKNLRLLAQSVPETSDALDDFDHFFTRLPPDVDTEGMVRDAGFERAARPGSDVIVADMVGFFNDARQNEPEPEATATIAEAINAARERSIPTDMIEIEIDDPSDGVHDAIIENGGMFVRDGYNINCHSETCNHVTHGAGQNYTVYSVFREWQRQASDEWEARKAFNVPDDYDTVSFWPVLVIPADEPLAVVSHQDRHYAGATRLYNVDGRIYHNRS